MSLSFKTAQTAIIAAGKRLDDLNLAPATSGNYSARLSDGSMAITVSGAHKGFLKPQDIMLANSEGNPLEDKTPSAETLLHCCIYRLFPNINAILHTHSVASTVLTRAVVQDEITLSGYEMLKAYPGVKTHDTDVILPIFSNTQDIEALSAQVEKRLNGAPAFIIASHGMYGWGKDMDEALRVIEATEMMLTCEMHAAQIKSKERSINEQINRLSGHAA